MATTFKWVAPETIATALTTELNSLANNTLSALSGTINNETDLFQFINLEVNLASLTPAVGGAVLILLLPTLDAVNFYDANVNFLDRIVATIVLNNATAAQRVGKEMIVIPPLQFKLAVYNFAGVALAATGNTLKYRRHNGQAI